ncbi:MAG: zinc-dependent alcohol dehydrogenase family protein [Gammaproteobacteria bacterium]|nr:zinc-dependent alcohol dehydrogenase family protein [Gammaproteobacteria bacterium]
MPRQIVFHQTGAADVLTIEEQPLQNPGKGEVRIKVAALGLNRAEIMFRMGQYIEQPQFPSSLGYEAAGIVDAVGPGVDNVSVGDRVSTIPAFSMVEYGVYGESVIVPAYAAARYPDNLSPAEGASIWMQYMTAWGALVHYGQLKKSDVVLITAASSSVGLAAIQIAKAAGATAIATTRGADKKQALLDAGADHVIVTNDEDLPGQVMKLTSGNGANMVFDPVAGPMLMALAQASAKGGTIFEYGALAPEATPYPLLEALSKGLTIRGYTLFEITGDPACLARAQQFVYDGLASGQLTPKVDRTFAFDDIVKAHRYMESNRQVGKIVVEV